VCRELAAPLGFALLGFTGQGLARDFAQAPPARFRVRQPHGRRPVAPRSIDRPQLGPFRTSGKPGGWRGQPFQGSCTTAILSVRARGHPGYGFTFGRAVHRCRPSDHPWATCSLSAGAAQAPPEVPSISRPDSLTRLFRNPLSRCPGSSISRKVLPAAGSFFRQHQSAM
jgi:hypothetical protein